MRWDSQAYLNLRLGAINLLARNVLVHLVRIHTNTGTPNQNYLSAVSSATRQYVRRFNLWVLVEQSSYIPDTDRHLDFFVELHVGTAEGMVVFDTIFRFFSHVPADIIYGFS